MAAVETFAGSHRRPGAVLLVATVAAIDLLVWGGDRRLVGGGLLPLWVIPVATTAVCGTLLLRHRHPAEVLAGQWTYALINVAVPQYYPFAGLLVALHAVAAHCRPPTARLALRAVAVPFGLFSYHSAQTATDGAGRRLLEAVTVWVIVIGVVWGLGRRSYASDRRARAAQENLAREAELTLEAERQRLARELHDSVTGAVTVMIINAAGARAHLPSPAGPAHDALHVIEQAGGQAMNELHRMLGLLRTHGGDAAPASAGALEELDTLADRLRRGGLDLTLEVVGRSVHLDPSVDLAAYRVVQESLTNVVKHGGREATARAVLDWRPDALHIDVHSTVGVARPAPRIPSSGLGLLGLQERVRLIGGTLTAGTVPDGWLVHAELPLTARAVVRADAPGRIP
jgi:signal transduction histidine kinase